MKKLSLGIAQNVKEIEFILDNKKVYDEITWIPLNLETLLFLKIKRLKHLSLEKVLNNEFHKTGIVSVENIVNKIKQKTKFEFFLKKRYLGAIRKYLNSVYFIIKIFEYIEKFYYKKNLYFRMG